MLVGVFKTNFSLQLFIIVFAGIALWIPGFVHVPVLQPEGSLTPLYNLSVRVLQVWKFLPVIAGMITLFVLSIAANLIYSESEVVPKNNFFVTLLIIMFSSYNPVMLTFHPVLPASLFVILAMKNSLNAATKDEPFNNAFNSGLYVAIASMFYFPSALFLVLILIGFIVSRLFSWRLWVLAFIGFVLPYLFLAVWDFWHDRLFISIFEYVDFFKNINFRSFGNEHSLVYNLFIILFALILFISFIKVFTSLIEKNISVRRAMMWIIWFALIASFGLLIDSHNNFLHSVFLMIPAALFVENYIRSVKRKIVSEIIFTILMAFVIGLRFFT